MSEGIALLDHHFFASGDPGARYLRADSFRENVIRLIVFDMHLAIEELLRAHIYDTLSHRSERQDETVDYVKGLGSRAALELAAQLGVIDAEVYASLRHLNSLRNRAAHHWDLGEPLRHRSGTAGQLTWDGRPLTPEVVKDEFLSLYGAIYTSLLARWRAAHSAADAGR
ncbi:MAG TPA: hypothetical protein VGH56_02910 [Solirubrobacteraceae bacterium]